MSLTLTAIVNSIAPNCTSVNFSDTTPDYGSGSNPTLQQVQSVTFQLYDSTGTTPFGTAWGADGWTPYASDKITLFANELGIGNVFNNGTFTIKYTITYITATNPVPQQQSAISNTFNVQCGATLCNTTLNHVLLGTMSGVTYPATINSFKIAGTTYTHTISAIANLADMAAKLNAYLATLTGLPQNVVYSKFVVNGSTLEIQNPYYTGTLSDYNIITSIPNTYAGASNSTTNVQVPQNMNVSYSCTTKVATLTETSGNWNGTAFPNQNDLGSTITFNLYVVGTGSPVATVTVSKAYYQNFLASGADLSALFGYTLSPCVVYNVTESVPLLNGDTLSCLNYKFQISYCGTLYPSGLVVKLNYQVPTNCALMPLCDATGIYNSTNNPSGYGIPNPTLDEIVYTTFLVTLQDGTQVLVNKGFVPDMYGSNCVGLTVQDLFGSTTTLTAIPDGVYAVTYSVFGACDQLLGSATVNVPFYCGLKKCLDTRAQANGCCDGDEYQSIINGYAQLLYINAVSVEDPLCAANLISQQYKQCIAVCSTC